MSALFPSESDSEDGDSYSIEQELLFVFYVKVNWPNPQG